MSEHSTQEHSSKNATTVRASKGGGGKWLIGAAAAVVLLGGGYYVWSQFAPAEHSEIALNDPYAASTQMHAAPLSPADDPDFAAPENATAEASTAAPRQKPARTASPSRTAAAPVIPEETIGITPASYQQSDELVVPAPERPIWARTPSPQRLSRYYPSYALERGREGEARLHCIVQDNGALDCERTSESSSGFGNAALRVARTFRHAPQLADGSDAAGAPLNLRVVFRIDENSRRS